MPQQRKVKGLGWQPDLPSHKDWLFGKAHPEKRDLPDESDDRRPLNPPVRDQGELGACVGFSATYGVGWLRRTDRDNYSTVYSPLQTYYDARLKMGPEYQKVDSGAQIRDAMDTLRTIGATQESHWPYLLRKFAVPPSPAAYTQAARWQLGAHYRCETVEEIMEALHLGHAVVGGIAVYESMFTSYVDRTGIIPMPKRKDELQGGHALYFDRYNRKDRLFRFMNSWGEEWGQGGYGFIPFNYIADQNLADDFWAMTAESPATTPWKD